MKTVTLYARVSTEIQSGEDKVSIQQQIEDMQAQVSNSGWRVLDIFVDAENYTGIQNPGKGKIVNPSGERADRPALLAMFEKVKTGEVDAVVCWRDDRLVRHPRVAVALEDALDVGDSKRNGRGKVQIYDATGAVIDRFTLSIKAAIWREENKRRVERVTLGKIGTLREGRFPIRYTRLGYASIKEKGQRGYRIGLGDVSDVQTIKDIFTWYTHGVGVLAIRERLIARGARQATGYGQKYDWAPQIIYRILKAKEYTGEVAYEFKDGTSYKISIPAIIPLEQWELAQKIMAGNKQSSKRNAKDIFLLQGLAYCGECGGKVGALERRYNYRTMSDGSRKRYNRKTSWFYYYCYNGGYVYSRKNHTQPHTWSGPVLDNAVWRKIVDEGIKNPENIKIQILNRQSELINQGDQLDGTITRLRERLIQIGEERAAYQRMFARNRISEDEFDKRMDETDDTLQAINSELVELTELRDDSDKVNRGLTYAQELLEALREQLSSIDQSPEELKSMDVDDQRWVQEQRRKIVTALVDRVLVYSDGRVVLEGVLDGSEVSLFESPRSWGRSPAVTRGGQNRAVGIGCPHALSRSCVAHICWRRSSWSIHA